MADLKKRIDRIEARLHADRDEPTEAAHCAACAWAAGVLQTLNLGGELAPRDKAFWDDILITKMDSTRAWKKWQTISGGLTV